MAGEGRLAPVDIKSGVCDECGLVVTHGYCFDCGMWVCEYCWASHDAADADDYDADDYDDDDFDDDDFDDDGWDLPRSLDAQQQRLDEWNRRVADGWPAEQRSGGDGG